MIYYNRNIKCIHIFTNTIHAYTYIFPVISCKFQTSNHFWKVLLLNHCRCHTRHISQIFGDSFSESASLLISSFSFLPSSFPFCLCPPCPLFHHPHHHRLLELLWPSSFLMVSWHTSPVKNSTYDNNKIFKRAGYYNEIYYIVIIIFIFLEVFVSYF